MRSTKISIKYPKLATIGYILFLKDNFSNYFISKLYIYFRKMENLAKKIIVTGANRGIGYQVMSYLFKKYPSYEFIMACRSIEKG